MPASDRTTIRLAVASELAELSDLCLRSKAVWGYDDAFLEACRSELTLRPDELTGSSVGVAVISRQIVGIVQVRITGKLADLEKLFVEPGLIGQGIGRSLFAWSVSQARAAGAKRLLVEADPAAGPFYKAMGMAIVGEAPSGSIEGRMLPLLAMGIAEASPTVGPTASVAGKPAEA